jgi:predicted nucleotidyltransferase
MRKRGPIDALLPRTRQGILAATLAQPERWWYLSDLAKHLRVPASSLQRELAALVAAGILERRPDGNRVYFRPDRGCPFFAELRGLIVKTIGLVGVLREALAPLADRIRCAFVYGSIARGEERSDSDVDLMVIGRVGLFELASALGRAQEQLGREVNPAVYSPLEFTKKLRSGYAFPREVLNGLKLFVVGNERDLDAALGRGSGRTATGKQTGA